MKSTEVAVSLLSLHAVNSQQTTVWPDPGAVRKHSVFACFTPSHILENQGQLNLLPKLATQVSVRDAVNLQQHRYLLDH